MNYFIVFFDSQNKVSFGFSAKGDHDSCVAYAEQHLAEASSYENDHPSKKFIGYKVLEISKLPQNIVYPEAFKLENEEIVDDLAALSAIHLGKLRHYRNMALTNIDILKIRSLGNQTAINDLEIKAQALRDLPKNLNFSSLQSPQEIHMLVPENLKEYEEKILNDKSYYKELIK